MVASGGVVAPHHLHSVRPYYWGAVYLSDAECQEDFDIDFHRDDGPVFSTAAHMAVTVVHAGTVEDGEGDVRLDLRVADRRVDAFPYEVSFELPSGRLWLGDADSEDEVTLQPGRWLLQVAVDDPHQARHVEIVISPLAL